MMSVRKRTEVDGQNRVNIYYMLANKKLVQACSLMQDALKGLMEGAIGLKKEAMAAMKGDVPR